MSVTLAIRAGRLVRSVVRDEHGQPKISDPALADQEWEASTDAQKRMNAAGGVDRAPPAPRPVGEITNTDGWNPPGAAPPGELSLASAAARSKHWEAELRELKFREAAGELVPAADVRRRLVDEITASKTFLLALPSRCAQAMPHLTATDLGTIENLVRESLENLAEGKIS